jgi:hypothetical protein
MKEYKVLMNLNKYKESFINDLIGCLSLIGSSQQVAFRRKFESNIIEICKHPTINLNETQTALISKVEHIIFNLNDFNGAVNMLTSFKNGVKNLKSHKYTHESLFDWKDKDGNEKMAHSKNLQKAHFFWNYQQRYILTDLDIENINRLLNTFL